MRLLDRRTRRDEYKRIDFVVEDEDTVLRDARKKAITDAEEKQHSRTRTDASRENSDEGGRRKHLPKTSLSTEAFGRGGRGSATDPSGKHHNLLRDDHIRYSVSG